MKKRITPVLGFLLLSLFFAVVAAANTKRQPPLLRDPRTTVHKDENDPHRAATLTENPDCGTYTNEECLGKSTERRGKKVNCLCCTKVVPVRKTVCVMDVTEFTKEYDICSECSVK